MFLLCMAQGVTEIVAQIRLFWPLSEFQKYFRLKSIWFLNPQTLRSPVEVPFVCRLCWRFSVFPYVYCDDSDLEMDRILYKFSIMCKKC